MRIIFLSLALCLAAVQSAAADGFPPATTAEIANGAIRHGVAVRVEGAIADAFQDETNRRYVFLLLRDGQDSVYVGIEVGSPSDYAKVIPLIGADAQIKCGGFDHAGKWETSLLMATYPERVDLSRCARNTEWFAESAKEASVETGKHMVNCTLEWLEQAIQ